MKTILGGRFWCALIALGIGLSGKPATAAPGKESVAAATRATAFLRLESKKDQFYGAAFCVDPSGIFVASLRSVNAAAKEKYILVIFPGTAEERTVSVKMIGNDQKNDLALLRADRPGSFDSLEIATATAVSSLAETVEVAGFGFPVEGTPKGESPVVKSGGGRITALRHDRAILDLIQFDGSFHPASIGGPLIDNAGNVIGMMALLAPDKQLNLAASATRIRSALAAANITPTPRVFFESPASLAAEDPAGRAPVPDEATRVATVKAARDLLSKEYADKSPKGRAALPVALLSRAAATEGDPVGKYVLLREACDAAIASGDLAAALQAAGEIGRQYNLTTLAIKADVITKLAPVLTPTQDNMLLAGHGLLLAEALTIRHSYTDARKLTPLVQAAANASRNVTVITKVRDRLAAVEAEAAEFEKTRTAFETLKKKPDDPEANLQVGRFLCLLRGEWDKGLLPLAKGSDAGLKAAAAADLASSSDPAKQFAAANAWWELSEKDAGPTKPRLMQRAGILYRQAAPGLTGLSKTSAERRASDAASVGVPVRVGANSGGAGQPSANSAVAAAPETSGRSVEELNGAKALARPPVRILKAIYGRGDSLVDVSATLQAVLDSDPILPVRCDNSLLADAKDPAPRQLKGLTLTYTVEGGKPQELKLSEFSAEFIPPVPAEGVIDPAGGDGFKIIAARYGVGGKWVDVTTLIQQKVADPNKPFDLSNKEVEDPAYGTSKHLVVWFNYGGRRYARMALESNGIHNWTLIR